MKGKIKIEHLFFAYAKNGFDKLLLKDCLKEIYYLGYSLGTYISLYEINKAPPVATTVAKTIMETCHQCKEQVENKDQQSIT